jgi:hypothetical protein
VVKYLIGLVAGTVVFFVGEIMVLSSENPLFPRDESLKPFVLNYVALFLIYIFSVLILQWNAAKIAAYLSDDNFHIWQRVFLLFTFILFIVVIPVYILSRLIYLTFDGVIILSVTISLVYFFASLVTLVKRLVFD